MVIVVNSAIILLLKESAMGGGYSNTMFGYFNGQANMFA